MLSDEARKQIAENEARHRGRQFLAGEAALLDSRFGARTYGALTEITVGVEIWTCEDGRKNYHNEPLGGYVVQAFAGAPRTYTEDGEIVEHPARYRCYDPLVQPLPKAFVTITEPEINRESITIPDRHNLVGAVRRFCMEVARGRLVLDGFEAQLLGDAYRLSNVLMGGG